VPVRGLREIEIDLVRKGVKIRNRKIAIILERL
jgi:hypothetical protein